MNRYMLTLLVYTNLLLISMIAFSSDTNVADLSIINDSDDTVLIVFVRHVGSEPRAKLLEAGEAIDFGRVYEASVQSYSTLWGYIAPAKQLIFPLLSGGQPDDVVIRIKGVSGRSLFQPFGRWDYDVIPGKKAAEYTSQGCQSSNLLTVLDAFPTAKRKIMYTPRYILGLPRYARLEDALEASLMLGCKWQGYAGGSTDLHKLAANVAYIIDESRKAFQYGQADVPLHIPIEMRSSLPYIACDEDEVRLAWY